MEIQFGPNIKDWPEMPELAENLVLKVVSEIHDPVTTTDELIPSGETSSYRSNPLGLAEFTLSRKDPEYVGRAKEIQKAQKAIQEGKCPLEAVPELQQVMGTVQKQFPEIGDGNLGIGSTIFAVNRAMVLPESRRHPVRKYLEAGQILPMNMQQKISFQPDQLGYAPIPDSGRRASV